MDITVPGPTIPWPSCCTCCLERATESVPLRVRSTTCLILVSLVRSLMIRVPYCHTCAERVRQRTATPWGRAIGAFALVSLGILLLLPMIASLSLVALLWVPPLAAVAGAVAASMVVQHHRERRLRRLPKPHLCDRGHAVSILGFSRKHTKLWVKNETIGDFLASSIPPYWIYPEGVDPRRRTRR
jgi:hypothetical protein